MLSKQIISAQNISQKLNESNQTLNNNLTQMDGQKMGCHICDHNIKTLEEESLDFLVSQKFNSNLKTKLIDEPNNPSNSCDNKEENDLKRDKQNSVPFKTLLKTSDAINNRDISAKHMQKDIKSKHSNDKNRDFKSGEHTLHLNGVNIHKTENFYSEDNENDISDTFEW